MDFEVAAVSLNNVDDLEISNCNIIRNRQDVPVVGMFSAARFIRYEILSTRVISLKVVPISQYCAFTVHMGNT